MNSLCKQNLNNKIILALIRKSGCLAKYPKLIRMNISNIFLTINYHNTTSNLFVGSPHSTWDTTPAVGCPIWRPLWGWRSSHAEIVRKMVYSWWWNHPCPWWGMWGTPSRRWGLGVGNHRSFGTSCMWSMRRHPSTFRSSSTSPTTSGDYSNPQDSPWNCSSPPHYSPSSASRWWKIFFMNI